LKELIAATPAPEYWLKGALAGEALYEGAPKAAGGLADEFLNVQFRVRHMPSANMSRVSVIVDNTWKTKRGNVKYAVKVLSGSKVLYQNDTVTHFYSARWKKDFFLGVDGFTEPFVGHDLPYLISTGLIPRYATNIKVSSTSLTTEWNRWNKSNKEIMGNGPITPYFPQTGGREDIGILPGWAARYLLSMDPRAKTITIGAGDLSGSFSIHLRDSKDDRIVSIEKYPTATLLDAVMSNSKPADRIPDPLGATKTPYTVDCAHQASFAFLPYLVTGDLYYLEEVYHWANFDVLEKNFDYRKSALGLVASDQVRGQAWALRTIADAAAIAPDTHPEKAYFHKIVNNNIAYFDTAVVAYSPLGNWGRLSNLGTDGGRPDDYMDPAVRYYTSPWMTDFLSLTFDHIVDLGYTNAKPTRDHLLKSAIGRSASGPDFNPYDAPSYHLALNDVSGRSYNTWGEVWKMSFAKRTTGPATKLNDDDCSHGYPYILRAALTAAMRENLPKAKEAYAFVDGALSKACFADVQSWALVPNATDKAPVGLTRSNNGQEAPKTEYLKKKLLNPHVTAARRNGALVLTVPEADSDARIAWTILDATGAVIQNGAGAELALPAASGRDGIRIYRMRTADGEATGMVPGLLE
jgi:hypothetical protein